MDANADKNGEIPNFTDSEWLKTPKTDCALKVDKNKEFYQHSRFVDLENTGERVTLSRYLLSVNFHYSGINAYLHLGQFSITNMQ